MLESILVVWVPDTINEAVKVCLDSPKLSSSDWVHYNDAAGGWDRWGVNAKLKLCNRKRPQLTPFPSQLKGMRNMNAAAFRTSRTPGFRGVPQRLQKRTQSTQSVAQYISFGGQPATFRNYCFNIWFCSIRREYSEIPHPLHLIYWQKFTLRQWG